MKHKLRKHLAMILALSMCLILFQVTARAEENVPEGEDFTLEVNPIYKDVMEDEIAVSSLNLVRNSNTEVFSNREKAVEYVRSQAVKRVNNIDITVTDDVFKDLDLINYTDILEHTGNPVEGDYLKCNCVYRSVSYSGSEEGNYNVSYYFAYFDTEEQQATLDDKIDSILESLDINNNSSDYQKIRAVYDWIVKNVKYDYEEFNNPGTHPCAYGTYAAAVENLAVCQGYSTLLYRLLLTLGIDSRVIVSNSLNHAWNIVKLDEKYYLLDSTWDAESNNYTYFLKGTMDFTGHTNSDDNFADSSFTEAYPLAKRAYSVGQTDSDYIDILGHAPDYTLTTLDGQKVTTAAENGRAKVLVYFSYDCVFSPLMIETLKGKIFPGVDIYFVEWSLYLSNEEYSTIKNKLKTDFPQYNNVKYCLDLPNHCEAYDSYRAIDLETGIQTVFLDSPSYYIINANNEIICAGHDYLDNFAEMIQSYLIDEDAPKTIGGTDDKGNHTWECVSWLREPTETKTGKGKFICKKCGKVKEEIVPNKKGLITGKCGDNATWVFDEKKSLLKISGKGALWGNETYPNAIGWVAPSQTKCWYTCEDYIYTAQVKYVIVGEGITSLGETYPGFAGMFDNFCNLEYISLPSTLQSLNTSGYYSFYNCPNLKNMVFHGNNPQYDIREIGLSENSNLCIYYPQNNSSWTTAMKSGNWFGAYGSAHCFGVSDQMLDSEHMYIPQTRQLAQKKYLSNFVCIECGKKLDYEINSLKSNTITAYNKTVNASTKSKVYSIGAKVNGGAKLTYKSDNKSVTVNSSGKVTVAKNFVGKVTITITSAQTSAYKSTTKKITITVKQLSQPMTVSPVSKSIKVSSLKKKAQSFDIKVKKAQGKVSFISNNKAVTVTSKGKVTVKKGTKKGTYKITVTANGKGIYGKGSKTVTIKVR